MPTNILHIHRVADWGTKNGGRIFIITAEEYEPSVYRKYVFRTFNQWAASLCQQAADNGRPLRVTWKETGDYDKAILNVEPIEREATA